MVVVVIVSMFDGTVTVQHKNSTNDQKESFMRAQGFTCNPPYS
jgi:hypothetical protein